mmetsp:Transcript_15202/g.23008  ORF Transcript_15202/g.23008 Transcript_15202/m.23008 type:complete len:543 (+) Transcript_15202:42-1670(+)
MRNAILTVATLLLTVMCWVITIQSGEKNTDRLVGHIPAIVGNQDPTPMIVLAPSNSKYAKLPEYDSQQTGDNEVPVQPSSTKNNPNMMQPNDDLKITVNAKDSDSCKAERYVRVSILALSLGQFWCNRNLFMNACYQDFPKDRLELIFFDTMTEPNMKYVAANSTEICGGMRFIYRWFNASSVDINDPNRSLPLGVKRNIQAKEVATGDIVVNMDNDDIYHPSYVKTVVKQLACNDSLYVVKVKPQLALELNVDGTKHIKGIYDAPIRAHQFVAKRIIFEKCAYKTFQVAEEHSVEKCMRLNNYTESDIIKSNQTNEMLLMKLDTPQSITHQVWYEGRTILSRLKPEDWELLIKWQQIHYEEIHELSRPPHIQRFLGVSGKDQLVGVMNTKSFIGKNNWKSWHQKHPKILTDPAIVQGFNSCVGYIAAQGQKFLPESPKINSTTIDDVKDVGECCTNCMNASTAGPIPYEPAEAGNETTFCTAFQYEHKLHRCEIFLANYSTFVPATIYYSGYLLTLSAFIGRNTKKRLARAVAGQLGEKVV